VDDHGLSVVLHNLPAGNWAAGDRGIACLPDRVEIFRAGVERAVSYASALGCAQLNCLAGILPPGVGETTARRTLVENLRWAAPRLADRGIRLLVEPLNTRDVPGFFLSSTAAAQAVIEAADVGNLFLQFDVYHMEIMEGGVGATIERRLPLIGHIQIADVPGRHEPGTGAINFPDLLARIDRLGYAGAVGCEYNPLGRTEDGLDWARPYLGTRAARPAL
jgi:hydroxypyruvate isomerase